ncbi:hypothetical protein BDQ12DRAFT_564347, partial [Crucibulum laeve]
VPTAQAGLVAYGTCQTGCNALGVACYAAAGFTFSTVFPAAAPLTILACNAALGTRSSACVVLGLAPTP